MASVHIVRFTRKGVVERLPGRVLAVMDILEMEFKSIKSIKVCGLERISRITPPFHGDRLTGTRDYHVMEVVLYKGGYMGGERGVDRTILYVYPLIPLYILYLIVKIHRNTLCQ